MKKIGIAIGTIFVLAIFIVLSFVPLGLCKDCAMEKWMQDHTLKVHSTRICKYEQGYLLIKEVYTGEELKERFGIEQFTKELRIPVEGMAVGLQEGEEEVFETEKVTVLTSETDPPHWWADYKYPQWVWFKSGDIYEQGLPINLAWKNTTKDTVKSEILEVGWVDNPIQWTEYIYDPIDGWISGDGVATDRFGIFGRYHANLWQLLDGNVVANAHHDDPVPHEADELEEAEELVAGYFAESDDTEWNVYEDSYDLDNDVATPYSNGWCTEINYGSATWYVPDDHAKIQWAVDNATAGDTIIVSSGTYYENVDVNKQLSLKGVDTGMGKPVVDAGGSDNAVTLSADGITLEGFKATNSGSSWGDAGIKVTSNNNTITGNNVSNNRNEGIFLMSSSNNAITGNNVSNNNDNGISLYSSSNNNSIKDNIFVNDGLFVTSAHQNTVEDNTVNGKPLVYLEDTSDIEVTDAGQVILVNCNNITVENLDLSNTSVGVELRETEDSIISNNNLSNNDEGIYLHSSTNNTITDNIASSNNIGILLHYFCNNNTITDNDATNNKYGIYLYDSTNNTLTCNNASNNAYGIGLCYSSTSNP